MNNIIENGFEFVAEGKYAKAAECFWYAAKHMKDPDGFRALQKCCEYGLKVCRGDLDKMAKKFAKLERDLVNRNREVSRRERRQHRDWVRNHLEWRVAA